uniref:glucuronosyltransferase n=1 Tax=Elaeophora elaphi TaxID=1147741 RepID=A0A0R3RPI1_9BILA
MQIVLCKILLLFTWYQQLECAKILVYSYATGYSHVQYLCRLSDALVGAGHDVTVLMVGKNSEFNTTGTTSAKIVRWERHKHQFSFKIDSKKAWESAGFTNTINIFKGIGEELEQLCEDQLPGQTSEFLMDHHFIDQLRAEKFEFGLCELFYGCAYGLFRKIGIDNYVTGIPFNLQEVMTDPNSIRQSSFLFVNSDEHLDFPRLISRKVVFVGGIARQSARPLKDEYKIMMEEAKDGAVLIAFGAYAKSSEMNSYLKEALVDAFKSMPDLKFIWKYENENDDTVAAPNIVRRNWIPQNDLLSKSKLNPGKFSDHPNLRAFITHCGLNSLIESVWAGVPIICIPLFGDQLRNAKIVEKWGIGISLNKMTLKSQVLLATLHDVLSNDKYQKMTLKLKQMMAEKPFTPREQFLRNVEYAIKFGPLQHFDIAGNNLNIFEYYSLDIIIPLLLSFLLLVLLLMKCIVKTSKKCWRKIYRINVKRD